MFGVLLVVVWHGRGPNGIDDLLGGGSPGAHAHLTHLAYLGTPWFAAVAVLVLATAAYAARDWAVVVVCLVAPAVVAMCEVIAKPVVDRRFYSALSYPSGHATLAATIGALVVLVSYRLGGRRAAAVAGLPAAALPIAVSVAVVHLGFHYPTDAIGGIALGVGVVAATAAVAGSVMARRR